MGICFVFFFRQVRTKRKSKKVMGGKALFCLERTERGERAMGMVAVAALLLGFFYYLLSDSGANMGGGMGILSVDCALVRYSLHTHNPPLFCLSYLLPFLGVVFAFLLASFDFCCLLFLLEITDGDGGELTARKERFWGRDWGGLYIYVILSWVVLFSWWWMGEGGG